MKRILVFFVALVATMGLAAQNTMCVKLKNGSVQKTLISDIVEITFEENAEPELPVGNAVDLGLSVKWADMNVGATSPEDCGYYYAWGETEPKAEYNWNTYFDSVNGSSSNFDKYAINKKTQLDPEDDVAHVKWQGTWRMPTQDEQHELRTECTWTWDSTKKGYKVTSKKNGNSIFLPAAGYRDDSSLFDAGSYGYYWSSELGPSNSYYAYSLDFYSGYVVWYGHDRSCGQSVRPVCP